jgi:uncharacterized protein DUF3467
MPEQSPANDANAIEFRDHKDGVCEIYTNFVDIGWGPADVYLRLGHLVPATQAAPVRFVVEVRASVNMAWAEAKVLRDMLTDAIERYEIANGELKWPQLAAQNLKEAREERDKQLLKSAPQGNGKAN